ncbi:MAG: hypothetical protein GX219_04815 [Tissierellia bacterium]|nr:hypothetical protein [Tissierellia bacterium]
MKLVICIIQDEDAPSLLADLMEKKYRTTKLSTTGGFLRSGNTTLLIGIDEDHLDDVLRLIDENGKTREITTSMIPMSLPGDGYVPYPIDVKIGGATVFVVDVEGFYRF